MKKLAFLIVLFSFTAIASEHANTDRTVSTRLCDYWKYDFNVRNYVCSFLGRRVNLMEASAVERTVQTLDNRIADLEDRIARLEAAEGN